MQEKKNSLIQKILEETAYIDQGLFNYKKFLQRLIALGKLLAAKTLEAQAKASIPETETETALTLKQKQYYAVFKKVWLGEGLIKVTDNDITDETINDYGLYAHNKDLDSDTKDYVNLALKALDSRFAIVPANAPENDPSFDENALKQLDKSAGKAIESYQTPVQKVFYYSTELLAILMGIAYGVTMVASLYLMVHLFPLLITGTIVFFVAGAYVNWKMANEPGYDFFNAIKGKLNPFDGFTQFSNAYGKVCDMGAGRKLALGLAFLLALSVGVAQAFFCYSAFITLIGAGMFFAPYVAGFFAAITIIVFTYLMFSGFVHLLQSEHPLDFFKKPFEQLIAIFDEAEEKKATENKLSSKLLLTQKIIAVAVTVLLGAICIAGLIAISIACGQTMTDIMTNLFHVAIKIAVPFSIAIGCVLSAIGEVPFIIENAFKLVTLVIHFFKNIKPLLLDKKTDKENNKKDTNKNEIKKICKTIFDVSCIIVNAIGNACLSVDPEMLAKGNAGLIYTIFGAIAEGLNNLVGAVENYEIEDGEEKEKQKTARETRIASVKPELPFFDENKFKKRGYSVTVQPNETVIKISTSKSCFFNHLSNTVNQKKQPKRSRSSSFPCSGYQRSSTDNLKISRKNYRNSEQPYLAKF